MTFLEACQGYACPPGGKVPAGEVEVHLPGILAGTGADINTMMVYGVMALFAIVVGGCMTLAARGKYKALAESGDYGIKSEVA